MLKNQLISIVLLLLLFNSSANGNSIHLSDSTEALIVLENLQLLPERGRSFSFQNIQNQSFQEFKDWKDEINANEVYWGKLSLVKNDSSQLESEWIVEFPIAFTDLLVAVFDEDGNLNSSRTGQFVPIKDRTFSPAIKANLINIRVRNNKEMLIYFKATCERINAVPDFNLKIYSSQYYYESLKTTRFSQGLFIGFMLMMLIYNLFLYFFAERDRAYLNYSLYILGIVLYSAYNSGDLALLTNSFWLPDFPKYSYLGKTSTYLVIFGYLHFLRIFLHLEKSLPRWNSMLKILLWVNTFAFMADVILMLFTNFNSDISDFVTVGNASVFVLFIFALCISLSQVRNRNVYFIISGIALMGIGSLLTIIARMKGVDYSTAPFQIGTIFEVIIFSLGLAFRRKRIEQEKQRAYLDLQKTELLRSHEQKETQRLKELDLLKSKLYTNITHEFRTPLLIINGHLDYIDGFEKEKTIIKRNSNQLLRLINQVLDLSKMEAGLLGVNLKQGNIVAFVQYLAESFRSLAMSKSIQLTVKFEEEIILMDFDHDKIEHIVYNLISNAIKFTPAGGSVELSLKTLNQATGKSLMFLVKDTGYGIEANQLPYIFDRFHKVNKRESIGTGIGLAFVKEIVDLLKGSIEVKSKVDSGTTFTVMLPVTNNEPLMESTFSKDAGTKPSLGEDEMEEKDFNNQLPILLLIEDNIDVANYVVDLLKSKYQVHLAYDGKVGCEKALSLVPDVIISDVMMPLKNGFQVTSELKENPKTSHIPVILLTSKATQADKNEGLLAGAHSFLTKPFDKQELIIRLSNIEKQRKLLIEKFNVDSSNADNSLGFDQHTKKEKEFLLEVKEIVISNIRNSEFGVDDVCKILILSKNQFYRKIKAVTGLSPTSFIREIRLNEALQLLQKRDLNISEIAYKVGFSDPNYFTRMFHKKYGKAPSQINK